MVDKVELIRTTGKPLNVTKLNKHGQPAGQLIDDVFNAIADGIRAYGDEPVFIKDNVRTDDCYPTAKYAVIFGYGRRHDLTPKHRMQHFKHTLITQQTAKGGYTFCFDGSFFKSLNNYKYWRFGINSPLANGEFLNKNSPNDRWEMIKQEFNIPYKDWHQTGNNIVICTQPDLGYSMDIVKTKDCLNEWIPIIRKHSDKPIIIKPHPNTKTASQQDIKNTISSYNNVEVIDDINTSLYDMLNDVYALVTWNSTVAIDSIVYGVPTFTFNNMGFAYPISNHDLNDINNPTFFNREQCLSDICYATWSPEELATGELWGQYKRICP